ncbi:MAG: tetratricopeptide repeat protein [Nitrosomonadales bacterium]|nr:tetratricopeptide repeat protein [Nitrosomonadales bacterium]
MNKPSYFSHRAVLSVLMLCFSLAAGADDFQEANTLFKQGQHTKAMDKVNAILATKPKDAQSRFLKGLILTEQAKTSDAISVFTALTNDYPELPEPYNNLAVLYASQGQYEKAKVALEVAIRTHPSYATAHENLGDIYAKMASQAYDRALQLDRSNTNTQTKLELVRELFSSNVKLPKPAAARVASAAASPAVVASAAPAPTAVPAAPAESKQAAPAKTNVNETATKAVYEWAAAWSAKNAKKYLAFYAKDFKTPNGEARGEWEAVRESRIKKPKFIHVDLSDLKVSPVDDSHVAVSFKQSYRASHLSTSGAKTLLLVKSANSWLIQEERSE